MLLRSRRWLRRLLIPPLPTLASADAYTLWASSYPPYAHNQLMEIEQETMQRLMPPLTACAVLDLACGTGRYSRMAQQRGARRVIGVDNSLPMLRAGLRIGQLTPVIEASMIYLPFAAGVFDVILCGLAIGHLPPRQMRWAVAEMARVLCSGGQALISDFHPFLYLNGRQRTFKAPNGMSYAVEHYPHLASDYFSAIRDAGMIITAVEEPQASLNGQTVPAVFVVRCQSQSGGP